MVSSMYTGSKIVIAERKEVETKALSHELKNQILLVQLC